MTAAWWVVNALSARSHLLDARASLEVAEVAARTGDDAEVASAVTAASAALADAADDLEQPQWWIFERLPIVGDDVRAVRTLATTGDSVGGQVLNDVLDARSAVDDGDLRRSDGSLDISAVQRLRAPLSSAEAPLREAHQTLAAIDTQGLGETIAGAVTEGVDLAGRASDAVTSANDALRIVLPMLSGDHSYAVVFQNSAELRPTGGLAGAWSVLNVQDGRVAVGRQGSGRDVIADAPVAPIAADVERSLGARVATDFRDTTLVPDYPTAASYQRALLREVAGVDVDGVVALDPVVVSYLLGATGPVTLASGRVLDQSNAVDYLLHQVYVDIPDPDAQDAFFAAVVTEVFDRLLSADLPLPDLIGALDRSIDERRFLVWSSDPAIQRRLAPTPVSGALPARGAGVGVYLADGTQSKMSYFLDVDAAARAGGCDAEGRQEYQVALTLRSTAPEDAASTEPLYVLGPEFEPKGAQAVNILMLAPRGGTAPTVALYAGAFETDPISIDGRPGSLLTLLLRPGDIAPLRISMSGPPGRSGPTPFGMTPTIRFASTDHEIRSACD